ncbi:MAG: helix-turn-helix domain-containing protein [Candidatus Heimdallarchaeota archaeon]
MDQPLEYGATPALTSRLGPNPTDQRIYHVLAEAGPLCRQELVKKTGLATSTIFDALTRLMIRGVVHRFPKRSQAPGRPRVFFEVTD